MRVFRNILITFLSLVILIIVSVSVFLAVAPQVGGTPKGKRLVRMMQAENYVNGKFQNTVETTMDMPFRTVVKVVREQFFGDSRPRRPSKTIQTVPFNKHDSGEDGLSITWFGHSTILLQVDGLNILTDPLIVGERASMLNFLGPKRFDYNAHVALDELPDIDLVLISHDHYDHLDYPTISAMASGKSRFLVPLGVGAHLERWKVDSSQIQEFNWWEELSFGDLRLVFAPARHFSGRSLSDRFDTLWGSWVIIGGSHRIYFSGDGGYFPGFREIGDRYGPFDLTFMECGAYNEAWSEIHMFPEEAAQAHLDLNGKVLMPIHWGKFDLSLHPWKESVERLTRKARELNIELLTPQVGQRISYEKYESTAWWEAYQ